MKKFVLLALAAASLFAQQPAPGVAVTPAPLAPGETIRVVDVKKGQAQDIQNNLGKIFPGISRVGQQLIVRGNPAVVDMIEDAIKKLDVPAPENQPVPNVEFTVQLLLASTAENADAKVPADLEPTVKTLRSVFPYKSYRVLDTTILRGRSGQELESTSMLSLSPNSTMQITLKPTVSSGPAPRTIRTGRLQLGLRLPIKMGPGETFQYQPTGIITEMDAKEGQKTVVGKANLVNSEDAIFLVITPKVIE